MTVGYKTAEGLVDVVRDVSLSIEPGQVYGLVGESGSGKSTLALAVLHYLPASAVVRKGRIQFEGRDLLSLDEAAMRQIWGRHIALVPQDPHSSLNPSMRVGDQLREVLTAEVPARLAAQRALDLLADVHLPDPVRVAEHYPHQLSGGMKQRVLIAMAISREPRLLVMDEPTTGLDATTQASILDLIADLIRRRNTSVLYVSHNLGVVAQMCDRVAVLYAGELMEDAQALELYRRPHHPYTQGLLDSVPRLGQNKRRVALRAITGLPQSPADRPSGCAFLSRCPLALEICSEHPRAIESANRHRTRCHRWEEIRDGEVEAHQPVRRMVMRSALQPEAPEILGADEVEITFPLRRSLAGILAGRPPETVEAVNGVTLSIRRGQALGLVGESGSGKTTLASAVMGLVEPSAGEIRLNGRPLSRRLAERDRTTRARMQMIFQDVDESLVPTLSVGATLARALARLGGTPAERIATRVMELIEAVQLPADVVERLPRQLSGGERQRVAIARAIASQPDLLIADEPVSSLDVSVQATVLNLLDELQVARGGGLFFISHDLAVVGFISDVVAVIYLGSLMQVAPANYIFDPPYHPYTEALLSAIPLIDPQGRQEQVRLTGDAPGPLEMPSGCPFHTRCPRFLGEICQKVAPPVQQTGFGGMICCHIPLDELQATQRRTFRFSAPIEGMV